MRRGTTAPGGLAAEEAPRSLRRRNSMVVLSAVAQPLRPCWSSQVALEGAFAASAVLHGDSSSSGDEGDAGVAGPGEAGRAEAGGAPGAPGAAAPGAAAPGRRGCCPGRSAPRSATGCCAGPGRRCCKRRMRTDVPASSKRKVPRSRSTVFRGSVLKELEREGKGASWVDSGHGMLLQLAVLSVFVGIDAHDGLAKTWSKAGRRSFPYRISSVVLVVKVATVALAGMLAGCSQGLRGVRSILQPSALLACTLPAGLLCAAQLMHYAALAELGAEEVAGAQKAQLVLMALLSSCFLGRRYTAQQWAALLAVTGSTVAFVRAQTAPPPDAGAAAGPSGAAGTAAGADLAAAPARRWGAWLMMLASLVIGCLAGILMERVFKQGRSESYAVQKARMALPGASVALASIAIGGQFNGGAGEFFEGWDARTVLVVALMLAKAWLTSFMVKLLSSVTLGLASTAAMLVTFAEARLLVGGRGLDAWEAATVAAIAGTTAWFAVVSVGARRGARSDRETGARRRDEASPPAQAPSRRLEHLSRPLLGAAARASGRRAVGGAVATGRC